MFGRKKITAGSSLILDIENGSVGGALLNSGLGGQTPRLFGETRILVPVQHVRDVHTLIQSIQKTTHDVLKEVSLVGARLRQGYAGQAREITSALGNINRADIFLSAPWGTPDLSAGSPQFDTSMQDFLTHESRGFLGDVPVHFHTNADAAVYGLNTIAPHDEALVLLVRGEMAELILLNDGVAGFGTLPHGHHLLLRTLKTHAGMNTAEARSVVTLGSHAAHMQEPLASAGEHFAEQFADVAHQLLALAPASSIVVLGEDKVGSWFARALTQSPHVHNLFPLGGQVRSLSAHHVAPYIDSRGSKDLFLSLDALFAHATV